VLLTRGMLGSVLYSTDRETQQLLTELLQRNVSPVVHRDRSSIPT
jgi:DUF2075 family protein